MLHRQPLLVLSGAVCLADPNYRTVALSQLTRPNVNCPEAEVFSISSESFNLVNLIEDHETWFQLSANLLDPCLTHSGIVDELKASPDTFLKFLTVLSRIPE